MSKELFPLREYQKEALGVIHNDLQTEHNVLLQAIMGAGKTVTTSRLVNRYYYETKRKFLILAHKQELVEQFYKTFVKMTNIPEKAIGICCASLKQRDISKRITIASIQTFIGQVEEYKGCDLLIIDECHRVSVGTDSQYDTVINTLREKRPNMRVLGITATPARLGHGFIYGDKHKPGGRNLFQRLNHQVKYSTLLEQGYLMPLEGKVANHESLGDDIASVAVNGDFVLDQLGEIMSREIHLHTAVEAIGEYCDGYSCICVFCCTIGHAISLHALLGDEATIVHSKLTPLEREANMAAWKSGKKRIMVSVNILLEGFDHPPLDCLVFARPTMSSSLFLQAVGRVLRKHESKAKALLVDLTDNTARFGTDLDRVKVSIPKAVEKEIEKEKEESLFKLCPMCEAEVHKALIICDTCGYEWPPEECKVATELPDLHTVAFDGAGGVAEDAPEPEWRDVHDMTVMVHQAKSGKQLGRITFDLTPPDEYNSRPYGGGSTYTDTVSVWLCLPDYYNGYAVTKAQGLWQEFTDAPFPETVEQLQFFAGSLEQPLRILVDISKEYPEVKDYDFIGDLGDLLKMPEGEQLRPEDEVLPF